MPVSYIALAEFCGGDQCLIREADFMMCFITITQPLQHFYSLFYGGFFNIEWCEASFERGVFLNMLVILIQCRRANALEFAA